MTAKHQSPEWRRTARLIRSQVTKAWDRDEDVMCWRHGHIIPPGAPFDVGHIDRLSEDNSPSNAAPECRTGNRSHGGRIGARITNAKHGASSTFKTADWVRT